MSSSPRILFLACHLPYPPVSGGRRRELELIRRLAVRFDVHLLVVSKTFEQDAENARELERFCERVEVFEAEALPSAPLSADDALPVLRHRCPDLTRRVAQLLYEETFDLVHVEGFYLMQHVPHDSEAPVLLVEQNIEFDLERQRAAAAGEAVHDMRTLRAELAAWNRADALGVLTPEDRDMLLGALPGARIRLVPDGADHLPPGGGPGPAIERPDEPLLLFLANFGYAPNVDAAVHLCEAILPSIRRRVPDVNLWLVGTDPPASVKALQGDRIHVTGRVPDVVPYIDAADVVACPLRIGGGIKVKAIEALRRGKCVVSTSVGVQGLPAEARRAMAVADEPDGFAAAAAALLADERLRRRAEERSAGAAVALPTWDAAADSLSAAYGELLSERDGMAVPA